MSTTSRRFRAKSKKVVYLGPEIDDSWPERLKEGMARRRLVVVSGSCPCGAQMVLPDDIEPGSFNSLEIEHFGDCPAVFDDEAAS